MRPENNLFNNNSNPKNGDHNKLPTNLKKIISHLYLSLNVARRYRASSSRLNSVFLTQIFLRLLTMSVQLQIGLLDGLPKLSLRHNLSG